MSLQFNEEKQQWQLQEGNTLTEFTEASCLENITVLEAENVDGKNDERIQYYNNLLELL